MSPRNVQFHHKYQHSLPNIISSLDTIEHTPREYKIINIQYNLEIVIAVSVYPKVLPMVPLLVNQHWHNKHQNREWIVT
eukprot:UN30317